MMRSAMSAAPDKPELAVFGGSFDPPHIGHVFLATFALSVAGVERVIAAPTFEHAFGKPLRPFEARHAMCELAFAPLPGVEVSSIERELGGTSRTLRLVSALQERHPGHQLRLLVGADILAETQRWQRFDEIVAIAPLLVAARAGHCQHDGSAPLLPEVSSSAIRQGLSQGDDVSVWLPRAVSTYIAAQGLYRASSG
ncbi:MAG: Nicotinate-nucleotide adenylyltransferase [Myxococcaceae bacterium]|nr:Nicotinate-nucleotide adenylyltransferase [Myxococcaceae bacterium]